MKTQVDKIIYKIFSCWGKLFLMGNFDCNPVLMPEWIIQSQTRK